MEQSKFNEDEKSGKRFENFTLAKRKLIDISKGGDETRLGYVWYVQGKQPNVPACTTCRHGLYNSMVRTHI